MAAAAAFGLYLVKPETHREPVDFENHPWSAVGRINSVGHCTGVVIGPYQVLTAAHCLYNVATGRFIAPEATHILLGYARGRYVIERTAVRYTMPPRFDRSALNHDWAILHVGRVLGPKPLRLAVTPPHIGKAVKAGGYSRERPHLLTADQHCTVNAVSEALIIHNCDTLHGDSGGPLLDAADSGVVVGINVTYSDSSRTGIAVSTASISAYLSSQVSGRI